MLSETTHAVLCDIAYHIELAERFVGLCDYESFKDDLRTLYAATRCLEIISEASRRLPLDLKQRNPMIAWRDMAAAGNIYRHEYENVEAQQVWDAIRRGLPPLKAVVAQELAVFE